MIELLKEIRSDVDFEQEKMLLTDGILDSFDIVLLLAKLSETFEIDIPVEEINEKNFNDVEALEKMIMKHKSAN